VVIRVFGTACHFLLYKLINTRINQTMSCPYVLDVYDDFITNLGMFSPV